MLLGVSVKVAILSPQFSWITLHSSMAVACTQKTAPYSFKDVSSLVAIQHCIMPVGEYTLGTAL